MIEGLKPYPELKESGVPGVGPVPGHWTVSRLKNVFREIDDRSTTGEESLLSLRMERGLVDHHEVGGKLIPPDVLVGYKRARPGELVMNRMRAATGLFGEPPKLGLVSPDYAVLRPVVPVHLGFYVRLFRTPAMTSLFRLESRGLGTGQSGFLRLYTDRFGLLAAALPPPDEQALIVRFLDHADRRIRRLIAAKQRMIKLLEEQKRAVIDAVLTRGLAGAPRRPSGVEWIGDVPSGWEIVPLRRRWRVLDCKHLTVPFLDDGEYPLASVREVQSFDLSLKNAKRTSADWHALLVEGDRKPRSGDVIYCRNVVVGAAAVVGPADDCAMGQDVCLLRSETENGRFLNYYLRSPMMARQLALVLIGSTFNRINVADVKALLTLVPPRAEQDGIVAHLDRALVDINRADGQARAEITILREYRTRLISDVVTGKLDVRAAAASLPADTEPAEPLDDAEPDDEEEGDEPADEVAE